MMRLALIASDRLPVPAVKGGAIQVLIDGIKGALAKEHELTVYSVADPGLPAQEVAKGIRYIRVPAGQYGVGVTGDIKRRPGEFDLIHVFNRPGYILPVKAASPQSRILLSLHNEMFNPALVNKEEGAAIIAASERILAISEYTGETLARRFPAVSAKIRTWYSGVDTGSLPAAWSSEGRRIRNRLRDRHGLAGKKVLLFVGRLQRKKGVHILLRAFSRLAREEDNLALAIVGGRWHGAGRGSGEYIQKLRKLGRRFKKRVLFTGFIAPPKLHGYYLMADIFICPSQWQEPLARVHYEAMAAGVPVITTNRGGNTEVIRNGENGTVIDSYRDPQAFARAIKSVLANPERALAMARAARKDVEERHSFGRVAQELLAHYREICAPAGDLGKG